jgi:hypothetical protein
MAKSKRSAGIKKRKKSSQIDKAEPRATNKKTVPRTKTPSDFLILAQRYLIDLECLREMFVVVLPVLEQKDKERIQRIEKIIPSLTPKKRKSIKIEPDKFHEFIATAFKLRRADELFRQQAVVALVSRFDEFLAGILNIVLHERAEWLKSDKTLTYRELLELQSISTAISGVVRKEIDSLMRESHDEQIRYIDTKLKLGLKDNFSGLAEFLEVTERRNLFAHTGGRVSQQYLDNCARHGADTGKAKVGDQVSVAPQYFERAFLLAFELGLRISQGSYRRLFTNHLEQADISLNHLTIRFLASGEWALAETINDFQIAVPPNLRGDGEYYYFALINRAIAQKFAGKDYKQGLKATSWSAFHPKYQLALEVLNDEFDKAEKTMGNEAVKLSVGKSGFRTWPLFRKFRSTPQFARGYKRHFKQDYVPDPQRDLLDLEKSIKGLEPPVNVPAGV